MSMKKSALSADRPESVAGKMIELPNHITVCARTVCRKALTQ